MELGVQETLFSGTKPRRCSFFLPTNAMRRTFHPRTHVLTALTSAIAGSSERANSRPFIPSKKFSALKTVPAR
jgi:hypothetical protein